MKNILNMVIITALVCCSNKMQVMRNSKNVIELINIEHQKMEGIKNNSFQSYNKRVYEVREKAIDLWKIENNTSVVTNFIVIDWVSFEGADIFGEMIVNDSLKYFYKGSPRLGTEVVKYNAPVNSEEIIVKYLKEHRFKDLELLAQDKGKNLSGSNFIYIGMYERGMSNIYAKAMPAFMSNN